MINTRVDTFSENWTCLVKNLTNKKLVASAPTKLAFINSELQCAILDNLLTALHCTTLFFIALYYTQMHRERKLQIIRKKEKRKKKCNSI